ncbi:MAG: peptidase U32 family protein, partial [Fusobacteriaceae bacterium]
MKKIEILAPAGNINKLKVALDSGADAVFVGGRILNLRAGTENFSDENLKSAVELVKSKNKKIYLNLNAVPHNEELENLPEYLKFLQTLELDGVIVSDMGVFQCVREFSDIPVTVQTHSSNTNYKAVEMWKKMGAKKIVLDRDISLDNIAEICARVSGIEIELFVQGPVNLAISGRSILTNYMKAKDGYHENIQGKKFLLKEETRPEENMEIYEDVYGTYIFSSKDLCAIEYLDKILDLGIKTLKIEGGMRDELYLSTVVSVYREAVDLYSLGKYQYNPLWKEKMEKTRNIPFF